MKRIPCIHFDKYGRGFFMEYNRNDFDVYKDIQFRCGGEIYIGVVGPVRTGKSTFIKRFMDVLVLPGVTDENEKMRMMDELPQSGTGKTITTTEPKFVPNEAAEIELSKDVPVKVRLVDCVGFMVEGAIGHKEDEKERMVNTPWFEEQIPFTKAAHIGTQKVIKDHSTIGIMVTTDGTISDLDRSAYINAEKLTIDELKKQNKPFVVIVNTTKPYSKETENLVAELENKYQVPVMGMNCEQMKKDDIYRVLKKILYEFPVTLVEFYMPKWVEMLENNHPIKQSLMKDIMGFMENKYTVQDIIVNPPDISKEYCKKSSLEEVSLSDGSIKITLDMDKQYYFEMLSELMGEKISTEYELLQILKEYSHMRKEYLKVLQAMDSVKQKGYGVVIPEREQISLEKPEVIKHGNKYGVKIKSVSPSVHMIRANIMTEIAPIVGTQKQAEDLIEYIEANQNENEGIWETNIFGKSVENLVYDGIQSKISMIGDDSQLKLQDTMQKIVNESNGGMICIII